MWWLLSILVVGFGCFYWGYYTKDKEYEQLRQKWINSQKEVERLTLANNILGRGKNDD